MDARALLAAIAPVAGAIAFMIAGAAFLHLLPL